MNAMTAGERRAVATLASLFSLRMIGLFMIMPVFAIYGRELAGATPVLIGLAVGMYALTQALLQIPLSQLSDRIGRKRLIIQGMLLFAVGGAIAALSTSIWGVIIGRALQGAGAISGVVMALLADLTRVEQRTKAMAAIGMSIGLSFGLAFVCGPLLAGYFGLSGLFWTTSLMGLAGMAVCYWLVPDPVVAVKQTPSTYWQQFREALAHRELLRLNWGIFTLHLVMAAFFMSVPVLLRNQGGLETAQHGWVYLGVLFLSFVAIVPAIIVAEKHRRMKGTFVAAVAVLALSLLWLSHFHQSLLQVVAGLALFFIGFNLLEALLPSLVSKICPPGSKGTAMGIYSTSQFLGAFVGGPLGGALSGHFSYGLLFAVLGGLAAVWLVIAAAMEPPPFLSSLMLNFTRLSAEEAPQLAERLRGVAGVQDVVVLVEEKVAYLKVDRDSLDEQALAAFPATAIKA
ncbi:MAG: putative Permease of the major facilitator superfamily [Moraxellaceae bacterium]|jgi:MFS family permease|nr:putative Permease of the major facilitator superfamily [Moraxellaceae bacterium]